MAWNLKGSYIETCSCDLICPCNATFDYGATYDYCRVTLVFNIREGEVDGTDIGGLKVCKLGVFVDETPLAGEVLGIERAAFDVRDDGVRHSMRVGDVIDFEIEDIVPFGVETGEPVKFSGMFHPVASDLTIAEAKRSRINAFGIEYEGKTGLPTSEFSWAA
jgi:hypothetical protein